MTDIITSTKQASKGMYANILCVRGRLVSMERVPPPKAWGASKFGGEPKDLCQMTLEDAEVLKVVEGAPTPQLKDGKYAFSIPYAKPGDIEPHESSAFVRGFLKSAEELGIMPDWKDKVITIQRGDLLFEGLTSDDGSPVVAKTWFCVGEPEGVLPLDEYIKQLILGKKPTVAIHDLLLDGRVRASPDAKAVRAGIESGEYLTEHGLEVIEGIIQEK